MMSSMTVPGHARGSTLRTLLRADALLCAGCGVLLTALAGPLGDLLDLPVALLRVSGLALLPVAALIAFVATRERVPRAAVWEIVALNLAWVAASITLLLAGWIEPNGAGVAFVLAQAALVLGFAVAELRALRG